MRSRLTLDIERHRNEPDHIERDVEMGALLERPDTQHRIGFTAEPGRRDTDQPEDRA